jgi:retinol-binding protein 3
MPRFARTLAAGLIAVVSHAGDGVAQTPPALDAATRRQVIDSVTAQVERLYVDPDTGRMIANTLRTRLRAGAYDAITDPRRLSAAVTADLRSVNNDLHLSLRYAPNGGISPFSSAMALAERQRHYGLGRLEVLPGNVGYMEVTGFAGAPEASGLVVAALRYLETTDAIIIDVRRNNGGSPALANLIVSHFVGPDTIPTVTSRVRGLEPGSIRTATQYTLASVPGPRRTDVPLYVLTSPGTVSAGEWFTFTLQNLKRATVVGERTAGAGHNVTFVRVGFDFTTTISYSRVADARTGKEWEQVGVHPDVAVAPATALDVAHLAALDVLMASASDARKRELTRIRDAVQARRDSTSRP